MEGTSWEFVLCKTGFRRVRVINGDLIKFEGYVPAGFSMRLVVGDTVQSICTGDDGWVSDYSVVLDEGSPSIRTGNKYGKIVGLV